MKQSLAVGVQLLWSGRYGCNNGRYGCTIVMSYIEINKAVSQWRLTFNLCVSVTWPLTCAFHIPCMHTPEIIDMHRGMCDKLRDYVLCLQWLLSIFPVTSVFTMAMGAAMGCVRASGVFHNSLLANMLKVPMSFYDTTPRGRILNRFTKDIDSLDDQLIQYSLMFLFQMSAVVSTMIAIMYGTPIFMVVALVLVGLFVSLQVGKQIPKCTTPVSHNDPFCARVSTFLLQNVALRDICLNLHSHKGGNIVRNKWSVYQAANFHIYLSI